MAKAPDPELARLRDVLAGDLPNIRLLLQRLDILDGAGDIVKTLLAMVESGDTAKSEAAIGGIFHSFLGMLMPAGPVEAELAGAQFISLLRLGAPDEAVPDMLADLVEQAAATKEPDALATLRVLAVVGPPQLRRPATEAADGLGLVDPWWVRGLGSPKPRAGFGYTDESGDKEVVAVTFTYRWRRRHAMVVQIAHDLGGGVQNCNFFTRRVDVLRSSHRDTAREQGVEFHEYKPAQAREILDRALAKPPCPETQVQVEDIDMYLDLVRARVELLPA